MSLPIIILLGVGCVLIAYGIYAETTKCKMCGMKYDHHRIGCYKNKKTNMRRVIKNHEVWVTCKECVMCFDVREHGYTCPYCHTSN